MAVVTYATDLNGTNEMMGYVKSRS